MYERLGLWRMNEDSFTNSDERRSLVGPAVIHRLCCIAIYHGISSFLWICVEFDRMASD